MHCSLHTLFHLLCPWMGLPTVHRVYSENKVTFEEENPIAHTCIYIYVHVHVACSISS